MILEWLYQHLWHDSLRVVYGLLLLIVVTMMARHRLKRPKSTRPRPTQSALEKEGFHAKILCNRLEQSAFRILQRLVRERGHGEMVLAQVSMGEVMRNSDYRAFLTINSKRLDLLVISATFEPMLAVEIDGSGHFLNENSRKNDKIKTEALKSAGIALLRIDAPDDDLKAIEKAVLSGAEKFFKRWDKRKK